MNFILIYLLIINAVGFLVMTADKLYAKKNMRRIPERTLKFVIGIPLILLCQLGAVLYSILK